MNKVALFVLGKEVTPSNLLETQKELKDKGIELYIIDESKFEFELLKNDEVGMNVTIHYNDVEPWYANEVRPCNNVTELHFNYRGTEYAVESDIHSNGYCPHKGNRYTEKILVELQTKVAKSF